MATAKTKVKATKQIKSLDFSGDNSGIALVGPSVGSAANGYKTLMYKSLSEANVKKASEITVTMDIVEYLKRFFGLWETDAEMLAQTLGFTTVAQEKFAIDQQEHMQEGAVAGPDTPDYWEKSDSKKVQEYIASKIQSIQVMKSLNDAENIEQALADVSEEDYIQFLSDQQVIEKALQELDKEPKSSEADNSTKRESKVEGSPSKVKKSKEKQMTQQTEMVEKAALVAVEKAAEETRVALEKALKQLADIEEAQKQAIVKSKTDAVKAVVKDEKQAAVIVKAALALEAQEDFDALLEVFKSLNALVEKSDAFKELGASAEAGEDKPGETKLMKALKARVQAKQ